MQESQQGRSRRRRGRPCLLEGSNTEGRSQEDGEIQTRRLNEIPLEKIFTPAKRGPASPAVIEDVDKAPFAKLPTVAHQPPAALARQRPLR